MAFTQSDLNNIDQAIATGVLEVDVAGRRTRYQSIGALKQARALIAQELDKDNENRRPRMVRTSVSKGI